jgi:asparagine synthase (glutamine-hydrolysing)
MRRRIGINMCGIAGVFAYHNAAAPVRVEEVLEIREAIQVRGPDGAGLWLSPDKRLVLAHRRLSIIDLSEAGMQPMATPDQSVRVVFIGEIYNYRGLRNGLEHQGHRFQPQCDTEVLLHLYQEYGEAMMDRLRPYQVITDSVFGKIDRQRSNMFNKLWN